MANSKPKHKRRIWRTLAIALGALVMFLLLFVAAFIFNPFEASLAELRDAVPRGVDFFARKERLADDFDPFPQPKFWAALTDARGFRALADGNLGQQWQRAGIDRSLQQARDAFEQVRADSGGMVDVLSDLLGTELVVAGYQQDYSQTPPRPLAEPWWCLYTRVSWRVKAMYGLAGLGFVQGRLRDSGVDVTADGDLLVVKAPGLAAPVYLRRHLDLLMVANHKHLLEQSQKLLDGSREEEPIGQMAAYTEGASKRIDKWARVHAQDPPNVVEFVVEPNAFDGFRRFAAGWPSPQNRDSMNERVLASFLNLKGWQQIAGGVMFADGLLAATGQIGLNSKQHTQFQSSFYKAETEPREKWLDPFLRMVPDSACAAAALRMPAGDFMAAMFDSLEDAQRDLLNDPMRRASFMGTQLNDVRDLIDRVKVAFLHRTGFVFRKNDPDTTRDEKTGELMVPVSAQSPVPQVAWVFWLRPGGAAIAEELIKTLSTYYTSFDFKKVWHLRVPFGNGQYLEEKVTEFTNPKIPGTGEIAMIIVSDFFVLSNSGPLVRDIVRARWSSQTGVKSIKESPQYQAIEDELAAELSGLLWINGQRLLPVLDDYMAFANTVNEQPDMEWMVQNRPAAEDQVRRSRFAQYPSKASMPKALIDGEFEIAVGGYLREQWSSARTNFTADDRSQMQQFRAMAEMLATGCMQFELENNYVRFQLRLTGNM